MFMSKSQKETEHGYDRLPSKRLEIILYEDNEQNNTNFQLLFPESIAEFQSQGWNPLILR